MDPITIALGLASVVPNIIKWITGNSNAAATAQKVVDIASTVTGHPVTDSASGSAMVEAVKANPTLALQIQTEIDNSKFQLAKLASDETVALHQADVTADANTANVMIAETKSEHWLSWCWRPVCGLTWCAMTVLVYVVLPLCKIPVPTIPSEVWLGYTAILGVASFFRGKAQADQNVQNAPAPSQQG